MPGDDIDALVVFDSNDIGLVGVYDAVDRVIFSLAPGSPSLVTLQGSPADLFVVTPGAAPQPFAAAELFGLSVADNMDSLDFIFSTDPFADALRHGIRSFPGDMNCDDRISFGDINPFVLALSGQDGYMAAFPFCNWYNADCNGDGQVNFADINPFVALLSGQ